MPTGGTLVLLAALGAILFVGDKVVHLKPIQKTNHVICKVVTLGQKCKTKLPAKPAAKPEPETLEPVHSK